MPAPKSEWGRRLVAERLALIEFELEETRKFKEKMRKTGMVD